MSASRFWTIASTMLIAVAVSGGARTVGAQGAVQAIPANAYAVDNLLGNDWRCDYGYADDDQDSCNAVDVPANAYLEASGRRWKCLRGYRRVREACNRIALPANAYLTEYSNDPGWKCERGFRAAGAVCRAIDLPQNAHLDGGGNSWACNPPYRRRDDACVQASR